MPSDRIAFEGRVYNCTEVLNRISAAQQLHTGAQVDGYLIGTVEAQRETYILREYAPIIGFRRNKDLRLLGLRSTLMVRIHLYDPQADQGIEVHVIIKATLPVTLRIMVKD